MALVYVNYPNHYISIHHDHACGAIQPMRKDDQRVIRIDIATTSAELQGFANNEYAFNSNAAVNDMWIHMAFQNRAFEEAVTRYINFLLGQNHAPFLEDRVSVHCG